MNDFPGNICKINSNQNYNHLMDHFIFNRNEFKLLNYVYNIQKNIFQQHFPCIFLQ